jgi:hypothetical protein
MDMAGAWLKWERIVVLWHQGNFEPDGVIWTAFCPHGGRPPADRLRKAAQTLLTANFCLKMRLTQREMVIHCYDF